MAESVNLALDVWSPANSGSFHMLCKGPTSHGSALAGMRGKSAQISVQAQFLQFAT